MKSYPTAPKGTTVVFYHLFNRVVAILSFPLGLLTSVLFAPIVHSAFLRLFAALVASVIIAVLVYTGGKRPDFFGSWYGTPLSQTEAAMAMIRIYPIEATVGLMGAAIVRFFWWMLTFWAFIVVVTIL